ncbi:MAG: ribonuclease D [Rhodospirillaceae bacterium]|jgi:ribonuclease D|nr:ribonuclease D [Rhodospirillaceae bacterium]
MSLITDNGALTEFCARLSKNEFITVDTEFLRDRTYWPKLCLVQLGGSDEAAAIDTLAEGLDLTPLLDLMRNRDVLKVFHAGRQDFEIFFRLMGELPAPVFDTQVSAMVCGFGDSVGYETLVTQLARKRIDKTMRFTDWGRRPLSEKQLTYALGDVTHLRVVYEKLRDKLENNGRTAWVSEEMATLTDPGIYQVDPREIWKRLKVRTTKPRFLAILREVAAWREEEAQRRDVPRNRVLRDDSLSELAAHAPASKEDLKSLRGLHGGQSGGASGEAILAAIARGVAVPKADCPEPRKQRAQGAKTGPSVELLKVLLKFKCESHGVAQKLIANSEDIESIAADDGADVPALHGWRREIFGEDALALKQGRLALTTMGSKVQVVPLPG